MLCSEQVPTTCEATPENDLNKGNESAELFKNVTFDPLGIKSNEARAKEPTQLITIECGNSDLKRKSPNLESSLTTTIQPETFEMPTSFTKTFSISNDHDYLEQTLPFVMKIENPEQIITKSLEKVILLANNMKDKLEKNNSLQDLSIILNHVQLVQQLMHIPKETDKVELEAQSSPTKESEEALTTVVVKEEYVMQGQPVEIEPVEQMDVSDVEQTETCGEPEVIGSKIENFQDAVPLVILEDPLLTNLLELKKFGSETAGKAHEWYESLAAVSKVTLLEQVKKYFENADEMWKKLKLKFDIKIKMTDSATEIDRKIFSRIALRDKKELLAAIQSGSESEPEDNERLNPHKNKSFKREFLSQMTASDNVSIENEPLLDDSKQKIYRADRTASVDYSPLESGK